MVNTSIVIELNGMKVEVSVKIAKELQSKLNELFCTDQINGIWDKSDYYKEGELFKKTDFPNYPVITCSS